MATFYSKMSNYYQLKLEVTQKSQDVANNKTTLDWVLTLNMSHGYYFYDHQCTTLVKIGGVTVHSSDKRRSFSSATPTVLERGTVTVPHNSDGTLSAGIYANFDVARSSYTPQIPLVINSSMPISTIPRASTPTLDKNSVYYGDPVTINTNRKSTSFTHTLKATWNGVTKTVKTGITTAFTWYVDKDYMSRIPNNTSTTGILTLETYNGSTLIGKKTVDLKTIVPSSIKPNITSLAVSEAAQGLAAKFGAYIQSKSQLLIKAGASGTYGSTIKSYQIIANGQTFGSASATTGYVRNSGSNKITVNVTDSRGRTQSRSTTVDVLAYSSPRINLFDVYRCGPSGAAQANGDYARANYKGNVTSLGGKNDKAYTIKYKKKSNSTWTSLDLDNSSYMPDLYKVISGIDTKTSYDFRLEIADYFGIAYLTVSIGTASVFMDWAPEGRGLALNKYSEKEGLEVNWPSCFYKDIEVLNPTKLQHPATKGYVDGGIKHPIVIPSGADLNDYKEPGFFYQSQSANTSGMKNIPEKTAFSLEVVRTNDVMQIFRTFPSDFRVYVRAIYTYQGEGGWSNWRCVYDHTYYNALLQKGSNSNGSWEQYYDGRLIQYGVKTLSYDNISSGWGGIYFDSSGSFQFPRSFINDPVVTLSLAKGSSRHAFWLGSFISGKSGVSEIHVYRPANAGACNVDIHWYAIGKY